jgi:uncharacterized protein (TIGR02172 family)
MIGQMIGQGNTAEVYLWGDKEIVKLFRQKFPWEGVEREYHVSKEVEKLGLPVPKVGQMIELEGRKGITYERITGMSMLEVITKNPMSAKNYCRQLAEMHYQMHQCQVQELPKYKEALEWNIRHTELLSEKQRLTVLNKLEQLPENCRLCHGDFHPGNVIAEDGRTIILDWMTATTGSPAADVARTLLLLKDAALPENIPGAVKAILKLFRRRMADSYLKEYQKLSGMTKAEIDGWRLPIIAARLTEWVPENEKNFLLKEINKAVEA